MEMAVKKAIPLVILLKGQRIRENGLPHYLLDLFLRGEMVV
jgi:hypothetical protein